MASLELPLNLESQHQIIVPRKGIIELLRLLEEKEDYVNVTIANNHIRVQGQDFTFTSKLIDGRFPDYERVIPRGGNKVATIDRDVLRLALQRAAILSNEKFRGVRLELHKNMFRFTANNPEQEAAEDEVAAKYDENELTIGFNVNYLLDVTNTVGPGDVNLIFTNSDSSMLIEEAGEDANAAFSTAYVVMPMRL